MSRYKNNASSKLSSEDLVELHEFIYRYLDKRHIIDQEEKTITLKDDNPHLAIQKLFGVHGHAYLFTWAIERLGIEFSFIYPSGERKWYKKTTLLKAVKSNGAEYKVVKGKIIK